MTDTPDLMRRRLLAGVPLAGAALAVGQGAEAAETLLATGPADPLQPRFETNAHISTYYKLARS